MILSLTQTSNPKFTFPKSEARTNPVRPSENDTQARAPCQAGWGPFHQNCEMSVMCQWTYKCSKNGSYNYNNNKSHKCFHCKELGGSVRRIIETEGLSQSPEIHPWTMFWWCTKWERGLMQDVVRPSPVTCMTAASFKASCSPVTLPCWAWRGSTGKQNVHILHFSWFFSPWHTHFTSMQYIKNAGLCTMGEKSIVAKLCPAFLYKDSITWAHCVSNKSWQKLTLRSIS